MQFLYIIEDFNISQGYSRIFEKVLTYSWGPYFNLSTVTTRKTIFSDVSLLFFFRRVWPSEPNACQRKYKPRWIFVIRLRKSILAGHLRGPPAKVPLLSQADLLNSRPKKMIFVGETLYGPPVKFIPT